MYIEKFLETNKHKPFFTNLKRYATLNDNEKCICVLSFLSNLFIDLDVSDLSDEDIKENETVRFELLSIVNKLILYKIDDFAIWFTNIINN